MTLIKCKECLTNVEMPNKRFKMCSKCSKNKQLQRCKNYKLKNKEHISEYNAAWKSQNKEYVSEYNSQYNIENRATIQARQTKQHRERRKTDPQYKMSIVLRNRLRKFYTGENPKTMKLVCMSLGEFKKWIETQFTSEMTWENHGTKWHIDHVIPCYWFNLLEQKEREVCFHWSNMRPLEAKRNMARQNCTVKELLKQEILARNFNKNVIFEPLVTKLSEKSDNGDS